MNKIAFHYAIQTCDNKSFQNLPRYCGDDRALLTKKSVTSLLHSIKLVADEKSDTIHFVHIIDDKSSDTTMAFFTRAIKHFQTENLIITFESLASPGLANSIRRCYNWLKDNGTDFVFQIQDDYIFAPGAIRDVADIWFQMYYETETEAVITPYHDTYVWLKHYRNRPTPRSFLIGKNGFWIQIYDVACTFFTSINQFNKHWDLYEKFFYLIDNRDSEYSLENKSLNYMFTKRAVLGLCPVNSLSLHMQTDLEKDPYIDWKLWWDNIKDI